MNKTLKALETLREMVTQRGYTIEEPIKQKDDDSDEENETTYLIGSKENGAKKVERLVIFTNPVAKFNVDRVKEFVSVLNDIHISHCIVVYTDSVTSMAQKIIENTVEFQIELFTIQELQYNLTKHILVPKHICLGDEEAKEFRKKYGLRFPVILKTDPVCKFYNFKRGDVIKIVRNSDGNEYITHRIVKG
jgi:DNA-directed RNA polymerase I, II, and III subunit RPABC1